MEGQFLPPEQASGSRRCADFRHVNDQNRLGPFEFADQTEPEGTGIQRMQARRRFRVVGQTAHHANTDSVISEARISEAEDNHFRWLPVGRRLR